jgi:transglutaminase-like putative cysteine protease
VALKKYTMLKLIFPFLFISFLGLSQKKIDPTPEHINQAKELKAQFEKEDVVVLNGKELIEFEMDSKKEEITVLHTIEESLMNISSRADIQKYEMYDGQSSVLKFNLNYRDNKSVYLPVKDQAYKDQDLFHHDARVKFFNISFPVQGYIYNFESQKITNDIKYFTSIYFADEYQVLNKEIKIVVPNWLNLEFKEMNFEGYDISKEEIDNPKSEEKTIVYKIKNINARFKELQSPGPSYLYPHLLILAKSYKDKNGSHALFNETKDLYKWYKSLVDEMKDEPTKLQSKVSELTKDVASDEEKIKNIYYWVQDNIRYIAFEDGIAGFKPEESQKVFDNRYGDCKGMANLIKQMLKLAGYDARLTWIGTKRIAYNYSTPSLSVDNHMICTLIKDGKFIYLDGTEKYNPFGDYADRIQGKEVLIEDGDKFILNKVPVGNYSENKETYVFNAKIADNTLVGEAKRGYVGESKVSFLNRYNNVKTDKKENALNYFLNNEDKNVLVNEIKTSNIESREGELIIDYKLAQDNRVSSFNDEIYIDLDYDREFDYLDFKDRKTDFLFSCKKYLSTEIVLEIPTGYKVNNIPKDLHVETSNYKIDVSFSLKENKLHYKKSFIFQNAVIEAKDFEEWNTLLKDIRAVYDEQLILSKKTT